MDISPIRPAPRIEVVDLVKSYRRDGGATITPVDHINLTVEEKELVVLLGPSGCGKTTLLRCVAGLERPDEGEIIIEGQTVFSSKKGIYEPPDRRRLSMVFQSYALWPHLSVADNVAYPLHSRNAPKAGIAKQVTDKPFIGHPSGDYSSIMKNYLIDDLRNEAKSVNLVKSVHIETADGETDPVRETEWLQEVAEEKGMPNGIIARCDLAGRSVGFELDRQQQFGNFRGVRMLSFMGLDFLDAPDFRRGFKELEKRDLVYDMDAGWQQMHKAYALARAFPNTRIILGHCGFPKERNVPYFHQWRKAIAHLAQAPNVACKLSGLAMVDHNWTVDTIRPWIETCIEHFGVERCMFGTNWPLDGLHSDYATVVNSYREIVDLYSISEKRQLFRTSAENWYRI